MHLCFNEAFIYEHLQTQNKIFVNTFKGYVYFYIKIL